MWFPLRMAIDTMCSSSLVSIHLACQSILIGECEAAIAGGVNLSLHPNKFLMLGQNRFMSSKEDAKALEKVETAIHLVKE